MVNVVSIALVSKPLWVSGVILLKLHNIIHKILNFDIVIGADITRHSSVTPIDICQLNDPSLKSLFTKTTIILETMEAIR